MRLPMRCVGSFSQMHLVFLSILVGCVVPGCGGNSGEPTRVSVAGTVTMNGQPVAAADVSLEAEGEARMATTDKDGFYQIKGGAQALKYKVVISKFEGAGAMKLDPAEGMDAGQFEAMQSADGTGATTAMIAKQLIPERYSSRDKTELTVVIPLEGTQTADFKLDAN